VLWQGCRHSRRVMAESLLHSRGSDTKSPALHWHQETAELPSWTVVSEPFTATSPNDTMPTSSLS
jgi:hypothetical protein